MHVRVECVLVCAHPDSALTVDAGMWQASVRVRILALRVGNGSAPVAARSKQLA